MDRITIGTWPINVGPQRNIPEKTVSTLGEFLTTKWTPAVLAGVQYPWWSVKNRAVPSPIIRVDMAPELNGGDVTKSIFEVEVRPAALGICLTMNPRRIADWQSILNAFGCAGFVKLPDSNVQDDPIAAQLLGLPYYEIIPNNSEPYWIRAGTESELTLEANSLVPIREDGDKSYLVRLGLARPLLLVNELQYEVPFVVKPLIGSHMDGVHIFNREYLKGSLRGSSTQRKIVEEVGVQIKNGRKYLVQPYIHPQEETIDEKRGFTMWRLFYGWRDGRYQFIGGLWNWTNTLRVHGGAHAVWGPIDSN